MVKAIPVSLIWKISVLAGAGFLLWYWTKPRSYEAVSNSTLRSRSIQVYERGLKTKLRFQNEIREARKVSKLKEIPTGEPIRGENNIIFVETSCVLNISCSYKINTRQACSIESALKMNPFSHVFLLHTCPISYNTTSKAARQLFAYPNIKFLQFNMKQLMSGTPLDQWDHEAAFRSSSWPLEHSSDVIRFLVLWKYGGTYLDLDIVVIKSLDILEPNFVCQETHDLLGSSVMRMDYLTVGHTLANICVLGVATDFRGNIWTHNGPDLITKTLKQICQVDEVALMSAEQCMGVTVYSRSLFFPVPYEQWQQLFKESERETVSWQIKGSFGVHMWNKLSYNETVQTGSKQPYSLLAEEFCPRIYSQSWPSF